eukprot:scaffold6176_cov72-Skeletonema_marinoi.AAC.1
MNFGSSDAQSNSYSNLSGLVVGGPQQQQQQQIQVGGLGGLGGTPANTPPSSSTTSPATNNTGNTTNNNSNSNNNADTIDDLHILILQLTNPDQRESVLLELSKKRESFPDLAPILWHTFGTVSALLQEIVSIYPLLTPPTLTAHASNR